MLRNTQMLTILAMTGLIWFSCQKNDELIDQQVDQTELSKDQIFTPDGALEGSIYATIATPAVEPVIIPADPDETGDNGGNRTCTTAATYFEVENGFEYSSSRNKYLEDDDNFEDAWPTGLTVNVTDDKYVSWSFEAPSGYCLANLVVIVKGSNDANVYFYPDGTLTSDAGLVSPDNASGGPADLSNLTFCWNLVPCETEVCYDDETAWATGPRYVTRGNWATYTAYDGAAKEVILYAGQTYDAGTVNFSAVNEGVKITITLNPGFILNPDTDEAVKIQGYNSAPSGNPAPGKFDTYKGNETTITVDAFFFYGIHLDVLREVECED